MIKNYSQAAEKNKKPIWNCIQQYLKSGARVLEIGSGGGQHAVYFLKNQPDVSFLVTETAEKVEALKDSLKDFPSVEVSELNVNADKQWPGREFDIIYSANTLHIMAEHEVESLFSQLAKHLLSNRKAIFYGPFNRGGDFTSPSNQEFDAYLRAENPQMGLHCVDWLKGLAEENKLIFEISHQMPANNQLIIFKRPVL